MTIDSRRVNRNRNERSRLRRKQRPLGAAGELNALLDAAVDAIIVIDAHGRITRFSPAAERLFGYEAGEVIGKGVEVLMPEPDRSRHAGYIRRYQQTKERRIIGVGREVDGLRRDGTVFPMSLSVGEAVWSGGRRYVGIIRDLTPEREADRDRRALEARLAHVGRFSLMGEMAAGIAHEINQPLGAIQNYSTAARNLFDKGDLEGLREACAGITKQVKRAAEVVENIRNFTANRSPEKGLVDLNVMLGDALPLVALDVRDTQIQVDTELAQDLPPVEGNMIQLQQVLLNMTRNAVDALRDHVTAGPQRLLLATGKEKNAVWFSVTDNGPGVSAELGDTVLDPFVTTKTDGLGVGLAISRTIVERHGGRLAFSDAPGGGAAFRVTLPVAGSTESGR